MDENKFRELFEKDRDNFIASMKKCSSPEELEKFLEEKGLVVEITEASKIYSTINAFDKIADKKVDGKVKIDDESLGSTSGGVTEVFEEIIKSLSLG